jgi:hypothetical protein
VAGRGWDGDANRPGGPRNWPPPGVVPDPEKTRVLLEAGADPDDGGSLYHSTEAQDPACLRLVLEHGASTTGTNALAHARLRPARAGAHAAGRRRRPERARAGRPRRAARARPGRGAAQYGGDVNRLGGETWRGDVPLRTPYQHAVLRGRDLAVAALDRAALPPVFDVDEQEALIVAALGGRVDAVVDAVGPDFAGVVAGSPELTLIQHAAWFRLSGRRAPAARARRHTIRARGGGARLRVPRSPGSRPRRRRRAARGGRRHPTAEHAERADGPLHEWLSERA